MADLLGEPTLPMRHRSPLLPRGVTVFEDLPVRALVLDALAPAIDAGALRVNAPHATAVLVIRDGAVAAAHLFTEHERHSGSWVQRQIASWSDGVVTAERFNALQLELVDALLHGGVLYEDLRLEWTDWTELLADLRRRGGAFVVELDTPAGRGVTCIADGRHVLTYSDIAGAARDPSILEALALSGGGRVRVRRVTGTALAQIDLSGEASDVRPAAPLPAPADQEPTGSALPGTNGSAAPEAPAPPPQATLPAPSPSEDAPSLTADLEAPSAIGMVLPDVPWVAPWDAGFAVPTGDEPSGNGNGRHVTSPAEVDEPIRATAGSPTVAAVRDQLREIARRNLKMSSSRVEAAVDAAAAQDLLLDQVLADLRGMSIRGVMPLTIDAMIDEMATLGRAAPD